MANKNLDLRSVAEEFISLPCIPNEAPEHPVLEHTKAKRIPVQNRPVAGKDGKELKRKRLNLLILPSLYEDIKKIACVKGVSTNEIIGQALAEYRENEKRALDRYDKIMEIRDE